MMNSVQIIGRIANDLNYNQFRSGTSVVNFRLAVERNFKNQNGEREADFINIVAFKGTADALAQYSGKGGMIGVEGRLQTRNYENKEGQTVYITEVVANNIQFIIRPKNQENNQQGNNSYPQGQQNNNNPHQQKGGFNQVNGWGNDYYQTNQQQQTESLALNDDSLPF